jgi:hypothetical protein
MSRLNKTFGLPLWRNFQLNFVFQLQSFSLLTALTLTFPLNRKIEIPSTFDPILAFGSENVAEGWAKTRSKSGSIETAIPEVSP